MHETVAPSARNQAVRGHWHREAPLSYHGTWRWWRSVSCSLIKWQIWLVILTDTTTSWNTKAASKNAEPKSSSPKWSRHWLTVTVTTWSIVIWNPKTWSFARSTCRSSSPTSAFLRLVTGRYLVQAGVCVAGHRLSMQMTLRRWRWSCIALAWLLVSYSQGN